MRIYRLHRSVREASDYKGSLLVGGRWNPPGTAMLYAAENLSLACLEVLVHLDKSELPREYVWSSAELSVKPRLLEAQSLGNLEACRRTGRSWAYKAQSLATAVRSVVIPHELNVLLNPKHPEFAKLQWSEAQAFRFDLRLFAF
jgi:RES domain-containing protein